MTYPDTPERERPTPPAAVAYDPTDPAWAAEFHTLDGRRSGWFLIRAPDRPAARTAAEYQLTAGELLDEVYFYDGARARRR